MPIPVPPELQGALPETIAAWNALSDAAAQQGIVFQLADRFGGVRTQADTTLILQYRQTDYQNALNAGTIAPDTTLQQFRPIAPWGSSYHDYGAAFDIVPSSYPAGLGYDGAQKALGALAPSCGLRWGGTWTDADPRHFELNMSLAEARAKWANWQSSGLQSDTLTPMQTVDVQLQNPYFWALVAALSYTGFVIYRAMRPKIRWADDTT